jgi:hypothetical protein
MNAMKSGLARQAAPSKSGGGIRDIDFLAVPQIIEPINNIMMQDLRCAME